jgi:hypothetical protein
MAGKRKPTPEGWIMLGKLALEYGLADPFYFWAQAGVDRQALESMANKIIEGRSAPMTEGETVRFPEFRETLQGREEAGPLIALSARFVPRPLSTIGLSVDEKATAVVNSPKGVFLVDTSIEGTDDLSALWGCVIVLRFPGTAYLPEGVYIGRLFLIDEAYNPRQPDAARSVGRLAPLGHGEEIVEYLYLGEHLELDGMKGVPLDDREGRIRRMDEIHERALSAFRVTKGIRILGEVIGRITGHLKTEQGR